MDTLIKKLKRQLRFTEGILAGMRDLVRVVDENCRIIYINQPMRDFMGDVVGKYCYETMGLEEKCECCISTVFTKDNKSLSKEVVIKGRIFSVVSSPIRDENGETYASVEVLRDITDIKNMQKTIMNQNEKMKRDIEFAKYIQEKMLPKNGQYFGSIRITSQYIPCESLGGDVFDIIHIDEENVGIYMADVVGHGVTASMMAMFIKDALSNIREMGLSPTKVLKYLNFKFNSLELDEYYYVTILYGVFNKKTKELKISNAGHNCMPILIGVETVEEAFIPGTPISPLFKDINHMEKSYHIDEGERIIFYTDGISEAKNRNREIYGGRILDVVKKHKDEKNSNLISLILEDVKNFSEGNITDDIAIFILEPQ